MQARAFFDQEGFELAEKESGFSFSAGASTESSFSFGSGGSKSKTRTETLGTPAVEISTEEEAGETKCFWCWEVGDAAEIEMTTRLGQESGGDPVRDFDDEFLLLKLVDEDEYDATARQLEDAVAGEK